MNFTIICKDRYLTTKKFEDEINKINNFNKIDFWEPLLYLFNNSGINEQILEIVLKKIKKLYKYNNNKFYDSNFERPFFNLFMNDSFNIHMLKLLIKYNININKRLCLHSYLYCSYYIDIEIVKLCIENNYDINIEDGANYNALIYLCLNDNINIENKLLVIRYIKYYLKNIEYNIKNIETIFFNDIINKEEIINELKSIESFSKSAAKIY